jgi:hypothetical protein
MTTAQVQPTAVGYQNPDSVTSVRAPRIAGVIGIIFALLLGAALVLINLSIPANLTDKGPWLTDGGHRTAIKIALNLVPIAGVTFLGFIGVARDRIGAGEDRLLATLYLGSGLLFVAMLFVAAGIANGLVNNETAGFGAAPSPSTLAVARQVSGLLLRLYATRMAAVFTLSTSIVAFRTGALPKWIGMLGLPVAVLLLISVGLTPWVELLFPAWILVLSIDTLRTELGEVRVEPARSHDITAST